MQTLPRHLTPDLFDHKLFVLFFFFFVNTGIQGVLQSAKISTLKINYKIAKYCTRK